MLCLLRITVYLELSLDQSHFISIDVVFTQNYCLFRV